MAKVIIKTFQTTKSSRKTNWLSAKGVTLLEVILAVVIIAVLVVVAAPRLGGRNQQIKSYVRKIAVLSRDIRNQAKLQNSTYRLVIDIGGNPDAEPGQNPFESSSKKTYSYWVEKAPGTVMNSGDDDAEKESTKDSSEEKKETFAIDERFSKKPEVLPGGIQFDLVEVASRKEPITSGRAYIYYLPQGYVEESIIQLSYGDKLKWTIAIRPLTGKTDVYTEHLSLKDVRPE